MKAIRGVLRGIDRLNAVVAKAVAWLMLPLVLVIVYEVVMRYLFNRPTLWVFDVSYFLTSIIVILGAAYTLQTKGHVSVDVFYERFLPRTRALIDVVLYLLLFFTLWILIINVMLPHVINSYLRGERAATGIWRPLIWPFKAWILLGVFMLTLQGVAEFVRSLFTLVGKPLEERVSIEDGKKARL
jgi:TRAP-type mannitol/chloroaromatic compound transport system permease small subunit